MLGVDVGEPFTVDGYCGGLSLNADGTFRVLSGDGKNSTYSVMQAIENPTRVHRSVLTESEIAICKALGAKWVSMDDEDEGVQFWANRPIQGEDERFENDADYIAGIVSERFPSVKPGDCIEVPE